MSDDAPLLPYTTYAFSGRAAGDSWAPRDAAWAQALVEALGGTFGPLNAGTDCVICGTRPASKAIAKRQAAKPTLQAVDAADFLSLLSIPPERVASAFADEAGRAWLGELARLGLGALSVEGQVVVGHLSGPRSLDITDADLRGVEGAGELDLLGSNAQLQCADLTGLEGGVDLVDCDFSAATLRDILLRGHQLVRCTFDHADLTEACFLPSLVRDCSFMGATLQGTQLEGRLHGCRFDDLDLRQTTLRGSFTGSSFLRSQLLLTGRRPLTLAGADLRHADLGESDLTLVDLRDTLLEGADLEHADLRCAWMPPRLPDPTLDLTEHLPQTTRMVLPIRLEDATLRVQFINTWGRYTCELEIRRPSSSRSVKASLPDAVHLLRALPAEATVLWAEAAVQVEVSRYVETRTSRQAEAVAFYSLVLNRKPITRAPRTLGDDTALYDAIVEDRDNLTNWAVLADWLTEADDPRGALIARELACPPKQLQKLRNHHAETERLAMLGPLATYNHWGIRFIHGFADRLYINSSVSSAKLTALAKNPGARLLRSVTASTVRGRSKGIKALLTHCPVEDLCLPENGPELLATLSPQPRIRVLELEFPPPPHLPELFPNLLELKLSRRLDTAELDLDVSGFAHLERVRCYALSPAVLATLDALGVEHLKR